ncbi:hypothetical protein AMAG_14125 [Allomyces macrogynus ATCC 38327]|uniref:DNA-directed RNA polymerase I subunit RPA49 n=2 Tax=Allomyces macrogynus (strain ATCC 38327) TaxID=578462 RepID=A0A0L0T4C4_ALLM3|nr:hypothetical protein AMAG_14125 [Allomyces macrogynus ATCC 38327]|eukprot:KNE69565.1 hypothetical protein AMAG_14125 [Allomyces macrogynus ATCC 38327]
MSSKTQQAILQAKATKAKARAAKAAKQGAAPEQAIDTSATPVLIPFNGALHAESDLADFSTPSAGSIAITFDFADVEENDDDARIAYRVHKNGLNLPDGREFTLCGVHKPKRGEHQYRAVVSDGEFVQLRADNYGESAEWMRARSREAGFDEYLAVVRPGDKTATFVPAPAPLMLQQRVYGVDSTDAQRIDRSNYLDAKNQLGEVFGTKARRQQIRAIERNLINTDSLDSSSTALQAAVGESDVAMAEAVAAEPVIIDNLADPRPPHDMETDDPALAYPIDKLLLKTTRVALEGVAKNLAAAVKPNSDLADVLTNVLEESVPDFIARGLLGTLRNVTPNVKPAAPVLMRMGLYLYLHYLVKMMSAKDMQVRSSTDLSKYLKCPSGVAFDMSAQFCHHVAKPNGQTRATVSPQSKTKLACYAMVVALHLESFAVTLDDLVPLFNQSAPQLMQVAQAVGASVASMSNKQMAALGLPAEHGKKYRRATLSTPLKLKDLSVQSGGKAKGR